MMMMMMMMMTVMKDFYITWATVETD